MRVISMATTVSNLAANCLSFNSFGSSLASLKGIFPNVPPALGSVTGSLVLWVSVVSLMVSVVVIVLGTWCDDVTVRVLFLVAIATAMHMHNMLCSLSGWANLFSTRHATCVNTDPTAKPVAKRARVVKMLPRYGAAAVVSEVAPRYGAAAVDSDDHGDNDDCGRGDGGGCGDDDCGLSGDDGGDGDSESGVLQITCARGGVCKGCVLSSEEGSGTTAKDKKLSLSSNRFSR